MGDPKVLLELAERCLGCTRADNALDVQIEVALFRPGKWYASARANAAGTKVIYTDHCGNEVACWADGWTEDRENTAASLRALAKETTHDHTASH